MAAQQPVSPGSHHTCGRGPRSSVEPEQVSNGCSARRALRRRLGRSDHHPPTSRSRRFQSRRCHSESEICSTGSERDAGMSCHYLNSSCIRMEARSRRQTDIVNAPKSNDYATLRLLFRLVAQFPVSPASLRHFQAIEFTSLSRSPSSRQRTSWDCQRLQPEVGKKLTLRRTFPISNT